MNTFTFSNSVSLGDIIAILSLLAAFVSVYAGFLMYNKKKQDAQADSLRQCFTKLLGFCMSYDILIKSEIKRISHTWFWSCLNSDKMRFRFKNIHNSISEDKDNYELTSSKVKEAFLSFNSMNQLGTSQDTSTQIKATINSLVDVQSMLIISNPVIEKRLDNFITTIKHVYIYLCDNWLDKNILEESVTEVIFDNHTECLTFDGFMVSCMDKYYDLYMETRMKNLLSIPNKAREVLVHIVSAYQYLSNADILKASQDEKDLIFPKKKFKSIKDTTMDERKIIKHYINLTSTAEENKALAFETLDAETAELVAELKKTTD